MAVTPVTGEKERLAALRAYGILDSEPEEAYNEIVRLAAFICRAPMAAITLIDAERQWSKATFGLSASEAPRETAFCAHTIRQFNPTIVPDTTQDTRFADNPLVLGDPKIRFYAGIPLLTEEGYALGALCVADHSPRRLTADQVVALRTLAGQVMNNFELRRRMAAQDELMAERRLAEAGLLLLGGAVASAVDGMIITDALAADNPILYANPAFLTLTGFDRDEVIGRNCRFLQGEETDAATVSRIRETVSSGRELRVTLLNYKKNGDPFWNELVISPMRGSDGIVTHFVGVQHDVTALKRAQDAAAESVTSFRAVAETTPAAIVITGYQSGVIRYANPFARSLFGIPESADANTYSAADFYQNTDDLDAAFRALATQPLISRELGLKRLDGAALWAEGHCQRITYLGEQCVLSTYQDATARKEVEVQRERMLQAAIAAADSDPLTGLLNHRAFQVRLQEESARARRDNTVLGMVVLDLANFKFFNETYGHAIGDHVLRRVAEKLKSICRSYDSIARYGGDEFAVLLPNVRSSTVVELEARMIAQLSELEYRPDGYQSAIPVGVSVGASLFPYESQDCYEALHQADERLRRAKMGDDNETEAGRFRAVLGRSLDGFVMLDALVTAVDNKDRYTRRHSEDVMDYSLLIARGLGFNEREQRTVAMAALLHDVGKIGVPDGILRKPGRLTDAEYEAVKLHPMMGAVMVGAVPGLEETLDALRHHHERWDGGGYPFGLRGDETPLIARIMAVADGFSAMTTDRPYRKGMRDHIALAILRDGAGTQWDRQCVEGFVRAYESRETA